MHAYGYDFRNLMTDYDGPGSTNDTTYRYDALGRRVTKNVNGTKTAYVHDGLNTVAEYNGSDQLQRTYVTPGLDQNLSLTASGSTYYYLSDALGSIRQVLDGDQATQDSYDYQAFGSVYGSPSENLTQPFRFTGREWDGEASLYYYRARWYAPTMGRFNSRDPVRLLVLPNPYVYVGNRPVQWSDPFGLQSSISTPPGQIAVIQAYIDAFGLEGGISQVAVALRWSAAATAAAISAAEIGRIAGMTAEELARYIDEAARRTRRAPRHYSGPCTPQELAALLAAAEAACHQDRKCTPGQDVATINRNIARNTACAAAEDYVNKKCFNGGDPGHQQEANDAVNALANCCSIRAAKVAAEKGP